MQLADMVIMTSPDGARAAAEFTVHGEYIATDEGLPKAEGQRYVLPAGAFLELGERYPEIAAENYVIASHIR